MTSREQEPVTRFLISRVAETNVPAPPPPPEATIAAVAAALRKRAQQRRKRTWLVRGSLAATILVLVGGATFARVQGKSASAIIRLLLEDAKERKEKTRQPSRVAGS